MKSISVNKHIQLILTMDELRFIHQAFNEVCYALRIENFNSRIGDIDVVKNEMQRISNIYENTGDATTCTVQLELSFNDITIYQNVIRVVCDEMEDWEFQSRTGETRNRAMEIHGELLKMLDEIK